MVDPWDAMIEGDDAEVLAEIKADMAAYTMHLGAGNISACISIEKKYGLYGLSPQHVSEQLHAMTLPIEGGAA
jgi:hypothetical protein